MAFCSVFFNFTYTALSTSKSAMGTVIFPDRYSVTFKDYDESILATIRVVSGETATYPNANPEREGYNFIGWVTTLGGTTIADLSNVVSNMVVYAGYEQEGYTITITGTGTLDSLYCYKTEEDWNSKNYTTLDPTTGGKVPAGYIVRFIRYGTVYIDVYDSSGKEIITTQIGLSSLERTFIMPNENITIKCISAP